MEINRSFIAIFQASGFIKIETYSGVSRTIKEKPKPFQAISSGGPSWSDKPRVKATNRQSYQWSSRIGPDAQFTVRKPHTGRCDAVPTRLGLHILLSLKLSSWCRIQKKKKERKKKSHRSFSCKGKDSVLVEWVWVWTTQAAAPCVGGNREDSLSVSGLLQFTNLQLLNHCYHILISKQLGYNRKDLVSFGYLQGSWHRFQTFQVKARLSPEEQMTDIVSK